MKTDPQLGKRVQERLMQIGAETPMLKDEKYNHQEKIGIVKDSVFAIMSAFSLDMNDDSLQDTPDRVSKMYVNELFKGLDYDNFPKATTNENKIKYDSPVTVRGIRVVTFCEHHFATIEGKAVISYVPKDKVLGLSKFHRIVDFFSRRPQMQERLTMQIYHALCLILETEDISVKIVAEHNCVKTRGVEQHGSDTVTFKESGCFENKYHF